MRTIHALGAGALAAIGVACGDSSTGPGHAVGGHGQTIEAVGNALGCSSGGYGNSTCTFYFNPTPDTATAGTVTFKFDDVAHDIAFDTGPTALGDIGTHMNALVPVTVQAGTYTYHCEIHPYMKGTIVVH